MNFEFEVFPPPSLVGLLVSFFAGVVVTLSASVVCPFLFLKRKTASPLTTRSGTTPEVDAAYAVTTLEDLRSIIPAGKAGTSIDDAPKVLDYLDEQMVGFIERSPFVHVGTVDSTGMPFVSPKGDGPGFCICDGEAGKVLLIPERPGNKMILGLQNVLTNPSVGLCFQIPGNNTTLRVGGTVSLTMDPVVLDKLAARGLPALVAMRVNVTYAFFHCAKAYLRSQLWKPDTWPREEFTVTFGKYFSNVSAVQQVVDKEISLGYMQVQESVEGQCKEETGSGLVAYMRKRTAQITGGGVP